MWSRFKTVRVKPPPAHLAALPCTVTHERAVFGAVPGNTGCRQMSHTFFNWLMPTWHALNKSGWSDPAVFVDCTGRPPSGIKGATGGPEVETAPSFVKEAATVLTGAPLRSLRRLLTPPPTQPGSVVSRGLARLFSPAHQVTCFDRVLVGTQCSSLDHYNPKLPREPMVAFRDAVARAVLASARPHSSAATSIGIGWVPRDAARGVRVLLVARREGRRILNEEGVLAAVRSVPGVDGKALEKTYFDGPLHKQLAMSAAAHVMIGMDGTGLHNGNWLKPNAAVVYILPYGANVLLPAKGDNFVRMWKALGIRPFRVDVTNRSDTVHPRGAATPACVHCMNQLARGGKGRALVAACENPGNQVTKWYGCVLNQDQRLPVSAVAGAVNRAIQTW